MFHKYNWWQLPVAAVCFALFFGQQAQAAKQYLFVLAGQSNMLGASGEAVDEEDFRLKKSWEAGGVSADELQKEKDFDKAVIDNKIEGRVKFWEVGISGKGKFETLKYSGSGKELVQMHNPKGWQRHGPTLGAYFAAEFLIRLEDPTAEVYLVADAAAATGFSSVKKGMTWSAILPAKHRLYYNMIWHAKEAVKKVPLARVQGFLWLQGENDGGMDKDLYAAAVKAMVYGFRTQVKNALNARFLYATQFPKGGFNPANKTYLNKSDEAHRTIIASGSDKAVYNAAMIDTFAMQGRDEYNAQWEKGNVWAPLHYSAFGLRRIGRCFAAKAQTSPQTCEGF